MGKETKNNGNLIRLLASALGLFSLYFFLFSHYGFYLFLADYQELETWYPNYHVYIFVLVRSIHIGFGIALGYILIRLFLYLRESDSPVRKLVRFALSHKEALLMKNGAEHYSCQHLTYFWSAQTAILTITLFGYFLLKTMVPQHAQVWQLYLSRGYVILALNGIAVFMWMNSRYFISSFITFMYRPSGPYNIAVYRMVFFLILAKEYYVFMTDRIQYVESKPREALPFIGWLIDVLPISVETYYWACVLGIVCCVFLTLGLFTRIFLVANALLVFYILAVPNFYGKLWHSQLPIWISWFLLFAPISDVFSLDRLFFTRNRPLFRSPNYTFPIRVIWLQIGFIYFWSGFHKLSDAGFDWSLGQSMINQVRLEWFEHFGKLPFFRIDLHPWFLHLAGTAVIFFELSFLALLFHHRLRYISIIGGILMHNSIRTFIYIGFRELQLQYLVFVNFETVLVYLKRWLPIIPIRSMLNDVQPSIHKGLLWTCILVFGVNLFFGLFQVNSYPFSVYPTYSEIVASEKEYLHYEVIDSTDINVWELGKKSGFQWEHFTRLEYAIINKFDQTSQVDTQSIANQWRWWTNQIPELSLADTVDVYINRRSLNPDSSQIILNSRFLCRLTPNEN
jgi:hypothetical protein